MSGSGRPLILGHRGAPRLAWENTIAAFLAARDAGADGVELDVRRTADDVLVVHHDPTLPSGEALVELPWATITARHPEIPTLDTALAACEGMVVNVEIKNWPTDPDFDPTQGIASAVARKVTGRSGIVVSSFNLYALQQVLLVDPLIEVGLLGARVAGGGVAAWVADAAARGFEGVHPEADMVGDELMVEATARGLSVRVWTVDDPDVAVRLAARGVDAIITNDPGGILHALRA
jgi:glycerophosphoryl diester phosphodiesterase